MAKIFKDSIEEIERVKNLFLIEGKTIKEISNIYNCSTAVIQRFLKKHNIKKTRIHFNPTFEQILYINNCLKNNILKKDIAKQLNIPAYSLCSYLRVINGYGKYSNRLKDESWIDDYNPLFWYFLGFFTADGHLGRFNEIALFQKEKTFLQEIKNAIGHTGIFYGTKKCLTLHISSPLLHKKLENYGFENNKRYNAPFVKAPNNELQLIYLRGLFDGDGSIYYKYVSGSFEGLTFEICTGSLNIKDAIYKLLIYNGLKATIDMCVSSVGNNYYRVCIRNQNDIIKLYSLLYNNNFTIKYNIKYIKFTKLIKLIELHNQVEDIVGTSMKIEE